MAQYFGLASENPSEDSERIVADALRTLPNDWTVLHHVVWQSNRAGRQGDGEADFILIHPRIGGLVLEVKGGDVAIRDGRWKSTGSGGRVYDIKNPFEQASDSKHALVRWLDALGLANHIRVGHAVVFPHMDRLPNMGPAGPKAVSWTSHELASIRATVERAAEHWHLNASLGAPDMRRIVSLLAPTVEVRRATHFAATQAEKELLRLTAEQIEVFAGLRAKRGGLILGGAGTGKTVLAVARAMQLAADGFRTLLLCYNELLGADLESRIEGVDNLSATTFHSLCMAEARRANIAIPTVRDTDWWEGSAAEALVAACASNGSEYDAIVVDECQDFSASWIAALRCLLSSREDAPLFLFGDSNQSIWDRSWGGIPSELSVFELRQNLRNTLPISKIVARIVGGAEPTRGVPGPEPVWREIQSSNEAELETLTAVEHLIDQGFVASDVVVVCESPRLAARLRDRTIGPYSFGHWRSRGIAVETIARFKGLEATAIVLVLDADEAKNAQPLAYIGMSRARSVLIVVGSDKTRNLTWRR